MSLFCFLVIFINVLECFMVKTDCFKVGLVYVMMTYDMT